MSKRQAAGTVIFDLTGRVLLRAPTGNFGGYAWTFAKGGVDAGETLEEAAIRETREETGLDCTIVGTLGTFEGDTSDTTFFIAVAGPVVGVPSNETAAVAWVDPKAAPGFIAQTTSTTGRKRDLAVLAAAIKAVGNISALAPLDALITLGG